MEIGKHWKTIQMLFQESRGSSTQYAIATVNEDGSPHVTPIASLFLREDKTGFYFDEFPIHMSRNLERDPRVCILAVNSDPTFSIKSFLAGKYETPPAVRLMGSVGKKREGTAEEIALWKNQNYVKLARGTKGHDLMWENMRMVRDIHFDSFEPVLMGEMTQDLWR
ncbi:MAG: pyridoxamine 5'-phosphate oxidase family protein [Deltaproteobacteria bacterium]|nr:pyridoxamine 5'-phosphate oxidase family protein [Deltaproteobacteria bacterium]